MKQFDFADKRRSFWSHANTHTHTQRKDREREGKTHIKRQRRTRAKWQIKRGDKKRLVSKSVAYPNSFQRLQNLMSGWSVVDYLISTGGKAEEENGTTGGTKWEILPWMRVHFPQEPSVRPPVPVQPQQKALIPPPVRARRAPADGRAVRLGAPWLRMNWCARVCVHSWPFVPALFPYTSRRRCKSTTGALKGRPLPSIMP